MTSPGDRAVPSEPSLDEARLFHLALSAANAVAWVWDVEANDLSWFGDVGTLYDFHGAENHGSPDRFFEVVHPDDRGRLVRAVVDALEHGAEYDVEYRSTNAEGSLRWHRTQGTTVTGPDGEVIRMLGVATDITDRRAAEEKLARLALHDPLTDLPNRALLLDRLTTSLAGLPRSGKGLALLFVDLDGFKGVNDLHGHQAGDLVLVDTAARLRAVLRPSDTIARLGGDEFVVVAEVGACDEATELADRLVVALAEPHRVGAAEVRCPASVGVRLAHPDSTAESLLREADAAMYQAKASARGAGCWVLSPT